MSDVPQGLTPYTDDVSEVMAQYYPPRKLTGKAYWPDLSPLKGRLVSFFSYVYQFPTNLGLVGTLTPYQTIQKFQTVWGPYFLWGLTGSIYLISGGGLSAGGTFSLQLRDGITKQLITEEMFDSRNVLGTAQHPFFLPEMYCIPTMRPMSVQVSETAGNASQIQVCLLGARVYE